MVNKPAGPLEPIGVSPKEASRLTSVCVTNIFGMCERGELDSTLVNGRRIISFASLKKRFAPDKVRASPPQPQPQEQAERGCAN